MHTEARGVGPPGRLARIVARLSLVVAAARLLQSVEAQEALSFSLAGEQATRNRRLLRELQPYSFKAGDAEVRLGANLATEWNNNITLLEEGAISDVIFRPQMKSDISWPVTTANYLEANFTAGYSKYLSHSEFDRPFIAPGSLVSFDLFFRDVKLTLEDQLSYEQDPAESAVVRGTAEFGGIENLAGIQALADWKDINLSFSYHHLLFVSMVPEFDYLDRFSHQFFSRLTFKLRPDLQAGTEVGMTPTTYVDSYLRNNLSYSGGGYVEWTVSPHISLSGRGGAVFYHYDAVPGSSAAQDVRSIYFNFILTHQLRRSLSVSLDVGQDSQLGVNNDLTEQFHLRHGVNWMISQKLSASGQFAYERGTESGIFQTESFDRLSVLLAGTWQWSRRWNARLSWRFLSRDSDFPLHGYDNHRVLLEIGYQR